MVHNFLRFFHSTLSLRQKLVINNPIIIRALEPFCLSTHALNHLETIVFEGSVKLLLVRRSTPKATPESPFCYDLVMTVVPVFIERWFAGFHFSRAERLFRWFFRL